MIRVVSLFAGCGGSDMGLYAAAAELGVELEVVAAYDSWEPAVRVYNANLPHPVAQVCDLKALASLPDCDLVIGGPPCQDHSMAGKRACRCDKGEEPTARCCLREFVRLAGDHPYIMENVVSRLINAPWSEKLCAADFGDVTSRKRWFYSNYLLHVIPAPGPRRIRDIRDHAEDERVLEKRRIGQKNPSTDDDFIGSVTASPHGGVSGFNLIACKAGSHGHYDSLDSLQAHSWHGHDVRGSGKLVAIVSRRGFADDSERAHSEGDILPSLTANSHQKSNKRGFRTCRHCGHSEGDHEYAACRECSCAGFMTVDMDREYRGDTLRLGLRGNSGLGLGLEDNTVLGSIMANSFHANEASRIVACRNPSLLEMQRAHSFPDSWDWCGATKTQRGQMIANSWPIGMATAVCKAMLTSLIAEKERTA